MKTDDYFNRFLPIGGNVGLSQTAAVGISSVQTSIDLHTLFGGMDNGDGFTIKAVQAGPNLPSGAAAGSWRALFSFTEKALPIDEMKFTAASAATGAPSGVQCWPLHDGQEMLGHLTSGRAVGTGFATMLSYPVLNAKVPTGMGSGFLRISRTTLLKHQDAARFKTPDTAGVQLIPPGDGNVQAIPNFEGATSGALHTGHVIWLPDNITVNGATWRYTDAATYPILYVMAGVDATPTQMQANVLDTIKLAITAGQIPPCIVVFPNTWWPGDPQMFVTGGIQAWGVNCADGTFPLEDMLRFDLPAWLTSHTRANMAKLVMIGFSKGGFECLRFRAKFGSSFAKAYVTAAGPRLCADFASSGASWSTWNAAHQAKLFGNSVADMQAKSPSAHLSALGLFDTLGVDAGGLGAAPLLMLESDPGDATATNSMNNMINTRLPAYTVTFNTTNLDNASFTPTHNPSQYFDSWIAEPAATNLSWIATNGGW